MAALSGDANIVDHPTRPVNKNIRSFFPTGIERSQTGDGGPGGGGGGAVHLADRATPSIIETMMPDAVNTRSTITIERAHSPTDEVRALVDELERELAAHYAADQRHGLALDAIFQPHIRFFIARRDGAPQAVGCGGIALFHDFAEVKRMYVRPHTRGNGVADAIIARLIREAIDAGLKIVRLETGTEQAAAMRFYERSGFSRCAAFEPYASMPPKAIATSVFMEMGIADRDDHSVVRP